MTGPAAVIDGLRDGRGVGDDAQDAAALVGRRRASLLAGPRVSDVRQHGCRRCVLRLASIRVRPVAPSASAISVTLLIRCVAPREVLSWVPNANGARRLRVASPAR